MSNQPRTRQLNVTRTNHQRNRSTSTSETTEDALRQQTRKRTALNLTIVTRPYVEPPQPPTNEATAPPSLKHLRLNSTTSSSNTATSAIQSTYIQNPKLLTIPSTLSPAEGCLTPTTESAALPVPTKDETASIGQQAAQRLGAYKLYKCTLNTLLKGEQGFVIDETCGITKHCQLMSSVDYDRYTRLLHRLNEGRLRWAPHSDADRLSYDRLYRLVLAEGTEVVSDNYGRHYFIEPTPAFGSLHSHIQEKKALDEAEAQRLFSDLCAILAFCHTLGIMVRDLKLRKLVFADAAKTSLRLSSPLELHVCNTWNDDTLTDRHGCPAYVSPEIVSLHQSSFSGSSSDMWSAGVLLYVMLVGRYPFFDKTAGGLFEKIRRADFCVPMTLDCTMDARIIMHSLLRIDPKARPSAMSLLRSPWMQSNAVERIRRLGQTANKTKDDKTDQLVPCM
jgi:hypothetical protein